MGQKVHPHGFRLGFNKTWRSRWFADRDYSKLLHEDLKLRDRLVVIAQSDMGRTPTYNKGNGKDHWSIGSVWFMGRGIKGNRVVGESDDKQFAVPVDPKKRPFVAGALVARASATGVTAALAVDCPKSFTASGTNQRSSQGRPRAFEKQDERVTPGKTQLTSTRVERSRSASSIASKSLAN